MALNQNLTGCELAEASQRGGVRFYAVALARTASNHPETTIPRQSVKPRQVKQSYTRLSGLTQAVINNSVSFVTDRPLREGVADGSFAFLVS